MSSLRSRLSLREMKAAKRSGEDAIDIYASVSPTVTTCLSQLTTELQDLLEWAEGAGEGSAEKWGLDPIKYLGDALRLRNPARAAATCSPRRLPPRARRRSRRRRSSARR